MAIDMYAFRDVSTDAALHCEIHEGVIDIGGYIYKYKYAVDEREDPPTTLVFSGGDHCRPCFVLKLHSPAFGEQKQALWGTLMEITYVPRCNAKMDIATKVAALAAFAYANERGVTRIDFTDYTVGYFPVSSDFPQSDKRLSISEVSFLTTGTTWYESFLPIKPSFDLTSHREKSKNKHMDSVFARMSSYRDRHNRSEIIIPVDISDIDAYSPGSAILVLQRIKETSIYFLPNTEMN